MATLGYLHGNGVELIVSKRSAISYPLHSHVSVFVLGFVLDGAVELVTDKGAKIYRENDSFVILPYTPHGISAKPCYTLLSLCISSELAAGFEFEKAKPDIANFLHDAIAQPVLEARVMQALCGLALIGRMMPAPKKSPVSALKKRLEMYPERKYSVDEMAKAAFISKYEFIRAFRREAGLPPHQFQIQNRIRKAQRLLEGPATITQVALAAGFCDQSHFIRHFEKIVGLTPTGYRQACKIKTPLFATMFGDYVSAGINLANR